MEINDNVDSTTKLEISEEIFSSIYERSSSDGNNEKKTEEQVLENQQKNEVDEQCLGRSISREEERQSSQTSSIHLTSEQKWQEISNLKKQRLIPTLKEKMAKQIQDLKVQKIQLLSEIASLEQNSSALRTQLTKKQDIIAASSKRIQYLENLLSGDIQDIKNSNKRITDQLLSDLQKAVSIQCENTEENRTRMLRDYIKKDDYQRLFAEKIELELELKRMKENNQQNAYLQENRVLESQNAKYLKNMNSLKQEFSLQKEKKELIERKLLQKQSDYAVLQKHIQSNDTRIASQDDLIDQYQAQIENLKTLNAKLYQKCTNILSQTDDHISLRFCQEINAFTEQLQKLNEENKYLKEQLVKLKDMELETDRKLMMKEIQLSFSLQHNSFCEAVSKEQQYHAAQTIHDVESIIKMKNDELEAQSNNIKHLENIIQDTKTFYTTLLLGKQAEWKLINEMNDDKTKAIEIIAYLREQAIQELTKKLNKIESDHAQQKKKQRQYYKQQLSKSENLVMQLQQELDQIKQSAQTNSEQLEKLSQQYGQMISMVKLIEKNQDNVKNMLAEIENINKDHVFDSIVSALFSLSEKMQNNQLQISTHKLALKKMEEQIQRYVRLLQTEERIRKSFFQEKESQIVSSANQLKEKTKVILQLQEKIKASITNDILIKQLESKIEACSCQISKKNNIIQSLQKEKSQLKDQIEAQSIKIQEYRSESAIYKYKIEDLQSQIKEISGKNDPQILPSLRSAPPQDRQHKNLKRKYDSLLEQLEQANKLLTLKQQQIEVQKNTNEILEQNIATLEQRLKKSCMSAQIQEKEVPRPAVNSAYCCFFTARSMIEDSKGGKEFVVKSVEKYCSREVKAIEMIFRKDESNNNNFHSTFKPMDMSEGICLFLLRRADVVFGVATFPEAFKGAPSAFLFSVTNELCVFKAQEGFEQAFAYELNAITFGKKEIKIKSGFRNVIVSEIAYKGYFESYAKRVVFGQDFREVSEFDSFEIHKIHV